MSTLHADAQAFDVGAELAGPEVVVDAARLAAYGDGLLSSAAGQAVKVGANIHTDVELARSQGLAAPIADGMLSTNYLSSMLTRAFGRFYLENGELRTKFIKPVPVDTLLRVRGRVRAREDLGDGRVRYELDVWTENGEGVKVVDGDAAVEVSE